MITFYLKSRTKVMHAHRLSIYMSIRKSREGYDRAEKGCPGRWTMDGREGASALSCIHLCTDDYVAMSINNVSIGKTPDTPKPPSSQGVASVRTVWKSKARLTGRYWTTVPFCFPTASCFPLGLQHTEQRRECHQLKRKKTQQTSEVCTEQQHNH